MPRNLGLCITAAVVLVLMPVLAATERHELAISELESLQFKGGFQPDAAAVSIHEALRTNASLFGAYGLGIELLRTFQEPILTRGAIGVALFRSASPAVVLVAVGRVVNDEFQPEGLGSGAIVDPRGYILTNWHVVNGYSGALIFMKPALGADLGNSRAYVARVLAQDALKDLALLKMVTPPSGLPALRVGDISAVQVGQDIHVIGHPHGHCWSYTTGVVSQVRDYRWSYSDGSSHAARVIQLQTAINPGNSGGPVFDDSGKMIGLVAMAEEGQNLNYAVAANEIVGFLSTWLPPSTRGVSRNNVGVPQAPLQLALESAKTADGLTVFRSSQGGVVTYVVADQNGKPTAGFVKVGSALLLRASEWQPKGFFKRYEAELRNGEKIGAEGNDQGITNFAGH